MSEENNIPVSDEDLYPDEHKDEEPTREFASFRLGSEWYGLHIDSLQEVVRIGKIAFVPSAPKHIMGIMNVRGNILSVTDPKQLLGLGAEKTTKKSRVMVVEADDTKTGLLVDEIGDIVSVPLSRLEPPLSTLEPERSNYIEHTCLLEERLMAILQVKKLMKLT